MYAVSTLQPFFCILSFVMHNVLHLLIPLYFIFSNGYSLQTRQGGQWWIGGGGGGGGVRAYNPRLAWKKWKVTVCWCLWVGALQPILIRFQWSRTWNARGRSSLSNGAIADDIRRATTELQSVKVAQLASDWKILPLCIRTSLKHLFLRNFLLLVAKAYLHRKFEMLCRLSWLGRLWATKILFQALHTSLVDFNRSRILFYEIRQTKTFPEGFQSSNVTILH